MLVGDEQGQVESIRLGWKVSSMAEPSSEMENDFVAQRSSTSDVRTVQRGKDRIE